MSDRSTSPLGQLLAMAWTVLVCIVLLTIAVNLLRDIWPWLLGIAILLTLLVGGLRLLVWSRSRGW